MNPELDYKFSRNMSEGITHKCSSDFFLLFLFVVADIFFFIKYLNMRILCSSFDYKYLI